MAFNYRINNDIDGRSRVCSGQLSVHPCHDRNALDDFSVPAVHRVISVRTHGNSALAFREQKRIATASQERRLEGRYVLPIRAKYFWAQVLILIAFAVPTYSLQAADPAPPNAPTSNSTNDIMSGFNKDQSKPSDVVSIPDKKKRLVMFFMGVPLLIFILLTAALGIAMGMYGKPVYVPHMVCAGLSVTLAIAHAVVGIVWFYPF